MNSPLDMPHADTVNSAPVVGSQDVRRAADMERDLECLDKLAAQSDEGSTARKINKLIIQIPCFNEQESLGVTLAELPRELPGVGCIEWLIIDDGSTDQTASVARQLGADHVVRLPRNKGLAAAFVAGIRECIRLGADVIVNTDADNQYRGEDIQRLVEPIQNGSAEFVIGERPIRSTPHFSPTKKLLQRLGSWVVRRFSKTKIADAPSGFRAITRETAMRLNVFSDYTYTLETIIQAGQKNMAIVSVPVRTNPDLRPSRLLRSIPNYLGHSAMTIVRIFMTYRPFKFFAYPGMISCAIGMIIYMRFAYFYFTDGGAGHVQSLILGSLLLGMGAVSIVVGLITDLISVNRKLLEKVDWQVQTMSDEILATREELTRLKQDKASNAFGAISDGK